MVVRFLDLAEVRAVKISVMRRAWCASEKSESSSRIQETLGDGGSETRMA